MVEREVPVPRRGQVLAELSNALVALHREHFGRGPGAAKTVASDGMVVCVLTDVYSPVEKTLIRAGQSDHVRRARSLHAEALEEDYKATVEAVMGRPVEVFLSAASVDPDLVVGMFLLGRNGQAENGDAENGEAENGDAENGDAEKGDAEGGER